MDQNAVLVERRDGKGIITINRPKVLNAIDWDTFFLLQAALDDLNAGTSRSSAAQNKSARTGGDSSIDMSRLHEMLHSEFRD